jgi:ThiF family protein
MRSALLASCLGANAALRRALGVRQLPAGSYSLWDRCRYDGRQGPRDVGPVDVGRVLQAGAGAVGCGLGFFISFLGIGGAWTIVDGDVVDISNLNRQLLFTARDAGFPDSEQVKKAIRMAQLLGHPVSASPRWYGEDAGAVDATYDVVLALANDRGVRSSLQGRQPTVLVHATTSRSWEAQLHRHVAGRDDCIDCRLPPGAARFTCAEGEFQAPEEDRVDAALPPLSATAGLLLAAELKRLELGALVEGARNFTAVGLSSLTPTVQRKMYRCTLGCRSRRPPAVRQMIDADSRWLHLDGDGAASR